MPRYQYQCSSCEAFYEVFESISENIANGIPHCPKCDPERKEETTMFKYFGNCRPSFQVKGDGAYDNRMK